MSSDARLEQLEGGRQPVCARPAEQRRRHSAIDKDQQAREAKIVFFHASQKFARKSIPVYK